MSENALTKIEIEAIKTIDNFIKEREDIKKSLENFYKAVKKNNDEGYKNKLLFVLSELTKVTKRKTFKNKFEGDLVGINNNGLGVVEWGEQLSALNSWNDIENRNKAIKILKDDDLSLEISQEILNTNRINFLKLCNHIKTINENDFKDDVNIINIDKKIQIEFTHNTNIRIYINDYEIKIQDFQREREHLLSIIKNYNLLELINFEKIIKYKDQICKIIDDKTKKINEQIKKEEKINEFVTSLYKIMKVVDEI